MRNETLQSALIAWNNTQLQKKDAEIALKYANKYGAPFEHKRHLVQVIISLDKDILSQECLIREMQGDEPLKTAIESVIK